MTLIFLKFVSISESNITQKFEQFNKELHLVKVV